MLSFSILPLFLIISNSLATIDLKQMNDYDDLTMEIFNNPSEQESPVRRNETICCLIGFGIGVGCCILYRLISNFFSPSSSTEASLSHNSNSLLSNDKRDAKSSLMGQERSSLSSNNQEITVTYTKRARPSTLKRISPEKYLLNSAHNRKSSVDDISTNYDSNREPLLGLPIDKHHDFIPNRSCVNSHVSDEMTWSEISSSLGATVPLHESYHSNSLTGDSGVDCHEISTIRSSRHDYHHQRFNDTITTLPSMEHDDREDYNESFLNYSSNIMPTFVHCGPRRYDSDTALSRALPFQDNQNTSESHGTTYMSTEKGLERALEQTSRFYSDLEHIATDLNSLSKKYSQSQSSIVPSIAKYYHHHNRPVLNTIDALDWDLNDIHNSPLVQSPNLTPRKTHSYPTSSSLSRLNMNKSRERKKLLINGLQTDYNESDIELQTSRSYDCASSPLRRRPSSVYFDSTDNTSDDDNIVDETLQIPSSSAVLISSKSTEFYSTTK